MNTKEPSQSEINSLISLVSRGKFHEALDSIQALSKNYPEDSLLYNIKGASYAGLGQLASAVKSYEKSISIDPNYARAHYNLGDAYHLQNKYNESVRSYEKSIEIEKKGIIVNGIGSDTDIVIASAKAYLDAINKLNMKEKIVHPQLDHV